MDLKAYRYLIHNQIPQNTCDGVHHCAQDGGRFNELFKDVWFGGQWEAIIQHLLQQLIDHNNIVFNSRFCANPKIVLESKT